MNIQPLTPQSAGITGPMNINAVIAHLIEMTPSQRKQFAQVHMDDPMMLSAAKFVDNQVSKQAQSLVAQQTGAAPPPVNQQAVAQMTGSKLPEDTGIAQLPTQSMPSEYAKGGIVAFADTGLVDMSQQYVGTGGGQGRRGMPGGGERPPLAKPPVQRAEAPPAIPAWKETPYVPQKEEALETILKRYQDAQGPAVDPYAAQHEESRKSREAMAQAQMAGAKERQQGIEALLSKKEERVAAREERLKGQEDINLNMSLINAGLSMMQSTGKGLAGIAEGAQKGVSQYTEGLKMSEAARQKIEDARDAHDDLRFNLNNMSSKEIEAANRALEEGKIASTNESITSIMHQESLNRADATALYGARINQMIADKQIGAQSYEAERSRAHSGLQTDKQIAAAAREAAASRAAAAGNTAAQIASHEKIAALPGQYQQLYTALGKGDINKGYDIAMSGRGEGALDKVRLAKSEEYLKDPLNNPKINSRADAELWNMHTNFVKSSLMPSIPAVSVPDANMRSRP